MLVKTAPLDILITTPLDQVSILFDKLTICVYVLKVRYSFKNHF